MFIVVGIDFHKTDLSIREQFSFNPESMEKVYQDIKKKFNQTLILSTCNRMEVYFNGYGNKQIAEKMIDWLINYCGFQQKSKVNQDIKKNFYSLYGNHAIIHLFEVASGLHSMVIGENQILNQLKNAYKISLKHIKLESMFNKLFQSALAVGKKVRTETEIGKGGMSLGSISVDLVKKLHEKNSNFSVVMIGAGEIAEEVLKSFAHHGKVKVFLCNRDPKKAKLLSEKYKSYFTTNHFPFEQRYEMVAQADITIVSTNSKNFLLKKKELATVLKNRNRFTFFIDLSVPRNIDPEIEELGDSVVYSLDDLYEIIQKNKQGRYQHINECKEIIYQFLEEVSEWYAKKNFFNLKKKWDKFLKQINEEKKLSKKPLVSNQSYNFFLKQFFKNFFEINNIGNLDVPQEKINNLMEKNFLVNSLNQVDLLNLSKDDK